MILEMCLVVLLMSIYFECSEYATGSKIAENFAIVFTVIMETGLVTVTYS